MTLFYYGVMLLCTFENSSLLCLVLAAVGLDLPSELAMETTAQRTHGTLGMGYATLSLGSVL